VVVTDRLDDFLQWKSSAGPRERFVYHRGFLPRDASPRSAIANVLSPVLHAVIDAYLAGSFDLAQRRHDDGDYSYLIIRRSVRDGSARIWKRPEGKHIKGGGRVAA
jgi:hypothetical protein